MHESTLKCWINEKNIEGLGIRTSKRVTAKWIKQEVRRDLKTGRTSYIWEQL
jgi:hypothetical protein